MDINDILTITSTGNSSYIINVTTGTLVVTYTTGSVSNDLEVTEPPILYTPKGAILTFALNGDTATINERW